MFSAWLTSLISAASRAAVKNSTLITPRVTAMSTLTTTCHHANRGLSSQASNKSMLRCARRAVSNGAANWFELQGGAEVTGTDANGAPVVIRSEYLQALLDSDVIRSDRPVQVLQGRNMLRAGGVVYDHGRRTLELSGPVRAVLQVRGP